MNREDLQAFEEDTKTVVPGFKVAWKSDSLKQRLLGRVLWFNPTYMTKYVSTFYPVVYFPTQVEYESNLTSSFAVLAHERVHLLDTRRQGIWFRVSYLLPQVMFVPLSISALSCSFFEGKLAILLLVLALVSLLPWPSPGRTKWEKRGYAMTMAVSYWIRGEVTSELKQSIKSYFVGWPYYKMSWSPSDIDVWLTQIEWDLKTGTLLEDQVYFDVRQFLGSRGLLKT